MSVGQLLANAKWQNISSQKKLIEIIYKAIMISAEKEFGRITHTNKIKPWWNNHCGVLRKCVYRWHRIMVQHKKLANKNKNNSRFSYFQLKYEKSKKKYKKLRNAKNNYFSRCKKRWRSKLNKIISEADISSKKFLVCYR